MMTPTATMIGLPGRARLLALLGLAAGGCSRQPPAVSGAAQPEEPRVAFKKMTVRGWSAHKLEWELSADRVEVSRDHRTTVMKGLRRAALLRRGKAEVEASAGEVRLDNRTRDLLLAGGVTLRTAAGLEVEAKAMRWIAERDELRSLGPAEMRLGEARLTTPLAIYDAAHKRLVCPQGVTVVSPDSTLRANRLVAEVETRQLRLAGDVRMSMPVEEFEAALAGEEGRRSPLQELTPLLSAPGEGNG